MRSAILAIGVIFVICVLIQMEPGSYFGASVAKADNAVSAEGSANDISQFKDVKDGESVQTSGTWSAMPTPPFAITNCLLLLDGRVMCQRNGTSQWYALTPN